MRRNGLDSTKNNTAGKLRTDSVRKPFRNDIIMIAVFLLIALISFAAMSLAGKKGGQVRVTVDSEEYGTYSLAKDQEISISGDGWENILVIEDGAAKMTKADCPDKICVSHGKISKKGETIVCLPHKVVVEVISSDTEDGTEPDVISK